MDYSQNKFSLSGTFSVPVPAPEGYAYNAIPIHPHPDSCAVIIRFKVHTDANPHAGWPLWILSPLKPTR
ncbi:MAG: hypothetical protein IPJ06_04220 [Saprospiraceae bacterium]|nr:hypothetical protein [Saprospiraceae bacterium]